MTVIITHATLTGASADTTALVDGPKWDAAHTVTGLENVPNVDTTNASNLTSGTVPAARLPTPTASTLGGVMSLANASNTWINSIGTDGIPTQTQPAFSNISGQATLVQLPTLGASTVLGSIAGGAPIALTTAQHTTLVNPFTTLLNGSVPAPGSSTGKFLRDDQTWAVGGSGVTSVTIDGLAITGSGTAPPRFGYANATIAISAAASALTIALKDNAGANPSATSPATFWFRDITTTTGSWTALSQTGAMSLVISSGSTLGVTSSTAFRLWIVMFNDAGTLRLGVINCAAVTASTVDIYPLNSTTIAASTAEGGIGGADSAGVFYTGTAVASRPFVILGYAEWSATGLTAGTWTTTNLLYTQSYGHGTRLPGEVVQAGGMTTATQFNTTSSSYQTTNLGKSISPTSAANLIRFQYSGILYNRATVGSISAFSAMHRGSTLVGPVGEIWGQSQTAETVVGGVYYDNPNTTASTLYAVKIRNSDATTNMGFPATSFDVAVLTLEEIMT